MLELIGWDVGMSGFAALLLVIGALLLGAVPQFIGEARIGYEWVFTAVAVLVGGWLGSEAFGALSTWGAEFEGLFILPALIGGVVLGGIVDIVTRYVTGGSYTHEPRPI
jgi:uncharacterized membrane protein YeaQ/YmgE (transglycosylase-associated protein family)